MALDETRVGQYREQLRKLLPVGKLWKPKSSGTLMKLLEAIGAEGCRIDDRGVDLVNESDPRTTDQLLAEWEGWLGIPDVCPPEERVNLLDYCETPNLAPWTQEGTGSVIPLAGPGPSVRQAPLLQDTDASARTAWLQDITSEVTPPRDGELFTVSCAHRYILNTQLQSRLTVEQYSGATIHRSTGVTTVWDATNPAYAAPTHAASSIVGGGDHTVSLEDLKNQLYYRAAATLTYDAALGGSVRLRYEPASNSNAATAGMAATEFQLNRGTLKPYQAVLTTWNPTQPTIGLAPTAATRRAVVVAKFVEAGGQTPEFFVALAQALGYTVTIREGDVFEVGRSTCEDPINNDPFRFCWYVHAPIATPIFARSGVARAGDRLVEVDADVLTCSILRRKPSHTEVFFVFDQQWTGYAPFNLISSPPIVQTIDVPTPNAALV